MSPPTRPFASSTKTAGCSGTEGGERRPSWSPLSLAFSFSLVCFFLLASSSSPLTTRIRINAFLRRASRPFLTHVDDKNATSFLTADDVVFVARYGADDDGNLPDRFAELARTYWDQYAFAVQAEGGPASAAASASVLTCHRPHGQLERSAAALAGAATALEAFVAACSQPLVVDLTRRNELQQMGRGKSLVHFLYRTADERRAYAQRVQGLAQTYGEYLVFTTVDVREFGEAMVASLGLADRARDAARPLLAVQNPSNGQVFPFTGRDKTLTAPVVERFLGDIIRGAVRPWQAGSAHDEL